MIIANKEIIIDKELQGTEGGCSRNCKILIYLIGGIKKKNNEKMSTI